MNFNYKSILKIFTLVFLFAIIYLKNLAPNINNKPTPTEYINKKKDRKKFKQGRKEWMNNMHRSDPETDWKLLNQKSRKEKTNKVNELRKNLIQKGWNNSDLTREVIINREISGVWNEKGSNNLAGRIHTAEIDFDNDLIYCGSSGGNVWKGTIQGDNWISLNDHMQIRDIKMIRYKDFSEFRRLLICGGKSFYYTDNEGITIQESNGLESLDDWGNTIRSVIKNDNQNTIYLLVKEWDYQNWNAACAIYKSLDHGESFEKIIMFNDDSGYDLWTSRYSDSAVYVMNNSQIYVLGSNDELINIGNISTFESGDNMLTGGIDEEVFLYAKIGERIYFSEDGGLNWNDKGNQPQWTFMSNSFNSSNINSNIIGIGGMELFMSFNSASSWDLVNNWWQYYDDPENLLHADIPEIRFFLNNDNNEVALISTDGGLYISYDNLNTTQNLSLYGLGVSQYYSTYTKKTYPYHIYAGSQDQGFQRTIGDDGGILEFEQSISGDYGHLSSGDDGETIWCNYPGFTMYYDNPQIDEGGTMLNFPGSNYLWLAPLVEHPINSNMAWLGGGGPSGGGHIIELTGGPFSISYEELPFDFNSKVSAMAYSPIDPSIRYVLTENGTFFYSLDSGNNWNQTINFSGPTPQYFYGATIYPSPSQVNMVIIGGSGYSNPSVYKSENFGETFLPFSYGLPNTLVYEISGNNLGDLYFAATEIGPYIYSEIENQWVYLGGVSAPDQTYWSVEFIPELNTARFGTYGRGIWDFVIDDFYNVTIGDINLDNIVNIQDVIVIINFILDIMEPSNEQSYAANLNEDAEIDVLDVILLVNIILGR